MSIPTSRIPKKVREEYEKLLYNKGGHQLYKHIVGSGILNVEGHSYPEIVYLDQSDGFFSLFRQTGEESYFIIGKVLRRAAHCLYREHQRQYKRIDKEYPTNARFLNVVK